jgi:hypothetical protein
LADSGVDCRVKNFEFCCLLPAIRQSGSKAAQQHVLAFRQLLCYYYGNMATLFAVVLAMRQ